MRRLMIAAMLLISVGAYAQPNFYEAQRITAKRVFYLQGSRVDSISNDTSFSYPTQYNVPTQFAVSTYVKNLIANNTVSTLPWSSVTGKPTASGTVSGILSSSDWNGFNGKQTALNGTGLVRMAGTSVGYDNTTYYPASGGNLSSAASIGFPKINYPSTPASGFVTMGFNTSNNFFYKNENGYLRIHKHRYAGNDSVYYPNKAQVIIADSSDVATALAAKESSVALNGTTKKYWNGYKQWAAMNSDSCTEGAGNLYFTNARVNTQMNTYTGDIIFNNGNAALGNVNSNVGSYGGGAKTIKLTANSKGLVTAVSDTLISIPESQVVNLVSDLATKIDSIRQPADVLYANASFTKVGTTGVSNANLNSQTANTVFAAPNGSSGTPTFRSLAAADIPALSYIGGSGTSGYVPYFTGTSTLGGSSNFQWDNSNVRFGIGVTPSYRVHTKGADSLAATTQLMVDNSLGQHLFSITNDGSVNMSRSAVYAYTNSGSLPSLNISPTVVDSTPSGNTSYSLLNISPTVTMKNGGSSSGLLNISPSLTKVAAGNVNLSGSLFSSSANYTSFSFVNYAGIKLTPTYTSVSNLGSAVGHNFGFNFSPTLTSSGGNATYIGGFNYDPSLGAAFINSNIAFRNTSGDCYFGTTSGNVSIGATTSIATCAMAQITSTTKGLLLPRMTTTQKNAIASPLEGLQVYDLTLHQMSYYNGTAWVNY